MLIAPPRRGLFFPTGSVPRVNSGHRAAGMLSAAYLFGARPLSIIPGFGPLSVKTGSPTASVGPPGAYSAYTAIQAHEAADGPSGDMSVVLVAMRSITTGSAGLSSNVQAVCCTTNNTGSRDGIEFAIGNAYVSPVDAITIQIYTANVSAAPNSIWLDGKKDATGAITGATALTNGRWHGVGTTVTSLPVGDGPVVFGTFVDPGTFGLTGGIAAAFFFRGVLPDDLMSELTLNPAGLLTWPEDELWTFSTPTAVTVALTGVAGTGAVGTVGPQTAVAVSGVAGTGEVGTVVPSLALALTGVEGLAAVGDVGIGGDKTVALTGVEAMGAVGNVVGVVASSTDAIGGDDAPARREDVAKLSRRQRRLEREQDERAARLRATLERAYRAATGGDEPATEAALAEAAEIAPPAMAEQIADIPMNEGISQTLAGIADAISAIQRKKNVVYRDDDDLAVILSVF